MTRSFALIAAFALALSAGAAGDASAKTCKDAKGKFTACPVAATVCKDPAGRFMKCPTKAAVCKDAAGKFAKCGSKGAVAVK